MRGLSGRHQAKISAMELHSPFDSRGRKKCVPFFQLARLHISSYFHSIAATYFHYSIHIPYIFHHISTIPLLYAVGVTRVPSRSQVRQQSF
jgi:hypothetical protein